jgi:hypothetical protein
MPQMIGPLLVLKCWLKGKYVCDNLIVISAKNLSVLIGTTN